MKRGGGIIAALLAMLPANGHAMAGEESPVASAGARILSEREAVLAGNYDGGQTELAARLLLQEDGQFGFWLSYGALDEIAQGIWVVDGNRVLLTVLRYQSNDPDNRQQAFGESALTIENKVLILPRYGRVLRFQRDE